MKENMKSKKIMELREIMKAYPKLVEDYSDQHNGLAQPPLAISNKGSKIIELTKDFKHIIKTNDFLTLLNQRTSKRRYLNEALSLEELSFLLWATQGVKQVIGRKNHATLRTVPSAGARHPFETYLLVNQVEGLEQGLYHYLALEHKLEFIKSIENQIDRVTEAFGGQAFFGNAPVGFVWTVLPYRTEWRYSTEAQKYCLLDAGHLCQNLYLACEAIGCGTCAIGAYEQNLADDLLGLDSSPSSENDNEFIVYAASVGKVDTEN